MSYAVNSVGAWRAVTSPEDCLEGETYSEQQPPPAPIPAAEIVQQKIAELEATVTTSRLMDAVLGTDGGWLQGVQKQIADLKKTL